MGKRKLGAPGAEKHDSTGKTLFVRSLAYGVQKEDLETLFGNVGPTKSCFVVKDAAGKSRGFGYVLFALKEDAERAKTELNNHMLKGRSIKLDFAQQRASWQDRKSLKRGGKTGESSDDKSTSKQKEEPKTAVTIKQETVESSDDSDDDSDDGDDDDSDESGDSSDNSDSDDSDDSDDDGSEEVKVNKEIKVKIEPEDKDRPSAAAATAAAAAAVKQEPKTKAKSLRKPAAVSDGRTIVISGLTSSITSTHIKHRCKKFGKLEKIDYPLEGSDGVAHVIYEKHKDARKARTGLNNHVFKGQKIMADLRSRQGRAAEEDSAAAAARKQKKHRIIVRNVSFKSTKQQLKKFFLKYGSIQEVNVAVDPETKKPRGFVFVQYNSPFDAAKAVEKANGSVIDGRKIAVDWTVSKKDYEELKAKEAKEAANVKVKKEEVSSDGEDDGGDDDNDNDNSENESDDDEEDDNDSEDDDEDDDDEDDDEDDEADVKQPTRREPVRDVNEGKTLFIRNVSFDTEEESLREIFEKYGEVSVCKIVMDRETGRSRGMAFVKFADVPSLEKCLKKAGNLHEGGITVDGRVLNVAVAVDREKAAKLSTEGKETRENRSKDKRNLYLAVEGVIRPDSALFEELSKPDQKKRQHLMDESKIKADNPNFFVSKTRLSFHNLPLTADDKTLRGLAAKAAQCRMSDITQAKIVRAKDRVDAKGTLRSRGFGFVEFAEHQHALNALRTLNNNPKPFGESKRPIVQFAWENVQALKKREEREGRQKARMSALAVNAPPSATQDGDHRGGKKRKMQDDSSGPPSGHAAKKSILKKPLPARVSTAPMPTMTARPKKKSKPQPKPKAEKKRKPPPTKAPVRTSGLLQLAEVGGGHQPRRAKKRAANGEQAEEHRFDQLLNKYRNKLSNDGTQKKKKSWHS